MTENGPSIEDRILTGLTIAIGAIAAAPAVWHVIQLAEEHGQPDPLSYSVAACTETAAVVAGLQLRRSRREGRSTFMPAAVLVIATTLQLAAQVAKAQPTPWGVILAVVPAVTFLVLVKFLMSNTGTHDPRSVGSSQPIGPANRTQPAHPTRNQPIGPSDRPAIGAAQPIDPMEAIGATIRSVQGVRAAAAQSNPTRSTVTIPDPIDPNPTAPRSGRPTQPTDQPGAWTARAVIGAGSGSGMAVDALLLDLRQAVRPTEPVPSAESIRTHYGIGLSKARQLRNALTDDRVGKEPGGEQGEINS